MKPLYYLLAGIAAGVLLMFMLKGCDTTPDQQPIDKLLTKKDSIFTNKPAEYVVVAAPLQPEKVYIYIRDTVYRKEAEKKDIITGITIRKNKINIQRITPEAIPIKNTTTLPIDLPTITIDQNGQLQVDEKYLRKQRRKRTWRRVGNTAIAVGAFALGMAAAK